MCMKFFQLMEVINQNSINVHKSTDDLSKKEKFQFYLYVLQDLTNISDGSLKTILQNCIDGITKYLNKKSPKSLQDLHSLFEIIIRYATQNEKETNIQSSIVTVFNQIIRIPNTWHAGPAVYAAQAHALENQTFNDKIYDEYLRKYKAISDSFRSTSDVHEPMVTNVKSHEVDASFIFSLIDKLAEQGENIVHVSNDGVTLDFPEGYQIKAPTYEGLAEEILKNKWAVDWLLRTFNKNLNMS